LAKLESRPALEVTQDNHAATPPRRHAPTVLLKIAT
jgi:hypothetical protein